MTPRANFEQVLFVEETTPIYGVYWKQQLATNI